MATIIDVALLLYPSLGLALPVCEPSRSGEVS